MGGGKGRTTAVLGAAFAAALVLTVSAAQATPGALDAGFGSGGKVTTSFGSFYDEVDGLALQPDGKIVAAGYIEKTSLGDADFGLARYNPGGGLDSSFGTGGKVTTSFSTARDSADAVLVQPDGKIVAAGHATVGTKGEFALVRYDPGGSLDAGFGTAGKVTTDVGPAGSIFDAALQPDGKIVAVGYATVGTKNEFALARYNAGGSLDTSFGTGGKVTTSFGAGFAYAESAALQPDGKILASGYYYDGTLYHFALVRYNANGSLDTSFGTGGKVKTSIGPSHAVGRVVALQPDGKIVMGGYSFNGTTYDLTLIRYNANGSVDSSFGTGGKVLTSFGTGWRSAVNKLLVQPNGKIVAAGYTRETYRDFFVLARYEPDGTLDTSFGSGGKLKTSFGTIDDYAVAALLQPDGKIVVGGTSVKTPDYIDSDFALARYQGDSHTLTAKVLGNSSGGFLESDPNGIACKPTCSAQFADGSTVKLDATVPENGLGNAVRWHGCPHLVGGLLCTLTVTKDLSVSVTFEICKVPKLKGRPLKGAKKALRKNGCALGKVKKKHSNTVKKGRVLRQKPKPGAKKSFGYRVKITLSKGP